MLDLDVGVRAGYLYPVITFSHMRRQIRQGKLPAEGLAQVIEKRIEADRRMSALEEGATAGFRSKFSQRALGAGDDEGVSVPGKVSRGINGIDRDAFTLGFKDGLLQRDALERPQPA